MGRGTIQEHLGEGHYRVALDIDVSYARAQLAALQQYLAEFQDIYQAAQDRLAHAQAAVTVLKTRLDTYLAAAQEAAALAYAAMQAAYRHWRDHLTAQPDAGAVAFLRQALTDASQAFDEAHASYQVALVSSDPAHRPSPAEAWPQRSHALTALAVAQGHWANGVGPIEDEGAVNEAYDRVGVALDAFNAATLEFADAVQNRTPDQADKLSAMNYYQGEFNTAHGDWINSIEDHSGLIYVKQARDAYDQSVAVFQAKQKALANLLDNGGMPAELAALQAALEQAYIEYRLALEAYQSLTLLKTEKQTARDELLAKLLPFTEADGITEKHPVVNAWCVDLTETLTPHTPVATVEIPGEWALPVRIRPQFPPDHAYTARRDGRLQPVFASSPEATFWNWALHPGAEKWRPRYRLGRLKALDPTTETATVELDPQTTGEPTRARDGHTLEVNAPVTYVVDPQSGQPLPLLPGANIQVAEGVTTLLKVPIHYMDCNAQAFAVADHVLVEFADRDWNQPRVIGFADHPKPCQVAGVILSAHVNGQTEQVFLKETLDPAQAQLRHPRLPPPLLGGNLDWTASDGKTRVSFDGPLGRAIPPWILVGYLPPNAWGDQDDYALTHVRGYLDAGTPQSLEAGQPYYLIAQRYTANLYRHGQRLGQLPASDGGQPRVILGAAVLDYQAETLQKRYLVAVATVPLAHGGFATHETALACKDLASRPECIDHLFFWAEWPAQGDTPITAWRLFHTERLSQQPAILPPTGFYAFSGSGTRFASLVPVMASLDSPYPGHEDATVIRGALTATAEGVILTGLSLTPQPVSGTYAYSGDHTVTYPYGNDQAQHTVGALEQQTQLSSQAVVALDFIGETEVTLTGTLMREDTLSQVWDSLYDPLYAGRIIKSGATTERHQVSAQVTDVHRQRAVAQTSVTRQRSTTLSLNVDYTATPATGAQAEQHEDTRHVVIRRPVYYDLRTGAGVYLQAEDDGQRTHTRTSHCTVGEVGIPDAWIGANTVVSSRSVQLSVRDGAEIERARYPWAEASNTTLPIHYPYDEGDLMGVVGGPVINASGPWRAESAASACSVPWTQDTVAGVGRTAAPLAVYGQPVDANGAVIARAQQAVTLEWAEVRDWPLLDHRLNYLFASHLDIKSLWQAHLAADPPPGQAEPDSRPTALEAELTPRFRV